MNLSGLSWQHAMISFSKPWGVMQLLRTQVSSPAKFSAGTGSHRPADLLWKQPSTGSRYLGLTQTVEHYRIIQTYLAIGSTPYSPTLAARTSRSRISRPQARGDLSLDDCMATPPHRFIGIVAAKELCGQHILGSSLESHARLPTMLGH